MASGCAWQCSRPWRWAVAEVTASPAPTLVVVGAQLAGSPETVDIHIDAGLITAITPSRAGLTPPGAQVLHADGALALPSFIDLHTHTRDPGKPQAETVHSAGRAAAAGGYGVLHAMANTTPVTDNPETVMGVWQRGRDAALADIRPVGAITIGLQGERLAPIAAMHDTPAAPVLFSDDGHCVTRADLMRAALREVAAFDGVIAQHAQEATLTAGAQAHEGDPARRMGLPGWPAVAESVIVARDVLLAADTGARLHVCHVSTAQTVEVLRWAKARGIAVTAEVTPHHLLLTDEFIATADPVYKVNPPLRPATDVHAVREALADGTIDVVATDHAPHEDSAKSCAWQDAAMGMLGLETALAVVWQTMVGTGLIGIDRLVEVMSAAGARIARLPEPHVSVGAAARLALVAPDSPWVVDADALHSLSRNTPFTGLSMPVRVLATVHDGRITHAHERSAG